MRKGLMLLMLLVVLGVFSGCKEKKGENELVLESYEFGVIARDTTITDAEAGKYALIQVGGSGMMPVAGEDAALRQLRDSLERLAMVRFENGKALPRLSRELKQVEESGEESVRYLMDNLSIVLLTPKLVVWEDYVDEYDGGSHGMQWLKYLNYSLQDRKILTLRDIIKPDKMPELRDILVEQVRNKEDLLVEASDINIPAQFRITTNGIEFVWEIYEIAPYSAGFVRTEVYCYQLEPLMTARGRRFFNI